jgi:hypothetical protein
MRIEAALQQLAAGTATAACCWSAARASAGCCARCAGLPPASPLDNAELLASFQRANRPDRREVAA